VLKRRREQLDATVEEHGHMPFRTHAPPSRL
jgi:hypothetical protein